MTESTVLQSLLGGVLIGVSALVLLAYNGRIAGVSGVIAGLFNRNRSSAGDKAWRLLFLIGLIIGAGAYYALSGISVPHREGFSHVALVIAGLLVGYGTSLAGGCTSGHGVCGLARFSIRSLVAVIVFLGVAMVTTLLSRHFFGLGL